MSLKANRCNALTLRTKLFSQSEKSKVIVYSEKERCNYQHKQNRGAVYIDMNYQNYEYTKT